MRIEGVSLLRCAFNAARRMSHGRETGEAAAFGLVFIHRIGFKAAPAGMGDMIGQAAYGSFIDQIDNVKHQRGMDFYRRMQA